MNEMVADEPGTRTCLASGQSRPKQEMLRFVVGPENQLFPDLDEKLPGRGLWLSAERDMVNTACAKNLFAKRARAQVEVDADLADRTEALLARKCVELIGLARKAGRVVAGYEDVQAELRNKQGGLLLGAADGAEGGRRKIRDLARNLAELDVLSGAELGRAIGRERTVHMIIRPGKIADRLLRELSRLAGFRKST